MLKSYRILKDKKETDKQLFYQIHIVYIIANTLFRNKKFEASLSYISEMEELMQLKKRAHHKEFYLKNTLVKALNYNYIDKQDKAIELVEQAIKNKHNDIETSLDLHLSLLMFYFQKEDFTNARSVLSKFYHTDQYYIEKAGIDWVIKKNLSEILLYIEIQDDDLFSSRLKSFKRRYTSYLQQLNQSRILTFINYAERLYQNPDHIKNPEFSAKLQTTFEWTTIYEEDIFVISFYAWLKNKAESGILYQTTLKLLNRDESAHATL